MREHDLQRELIRAFAADPELKYFVGAGIGAGVAWLSVLARTMSPPVEKPAHVSTGQAAAFTWLLGPVNPAALQLFADKLESAQASRGTPEGALAGLPIAEIMTISGTGFAGSCLAILYLKAIFGEKGISGMVPFK